MAMGETAKRIIFRVQWNKVSRAWDLLCDRDFVNNSLLKSNAVRGGAVMARDLRESEGTPTQLVVHGKDGKIQSERTYGNDPRKSKG
jgi:hypothetical protein